MIQNCRYWQLGIITNKRLILSRIFFDLRVNSNYAVSTYVSSTVFGQADKGNPQSCRVRNIFRTIPDIIMPPACHRCSSRDFGWVTWLFNGRGVASHRTHVPTSRHRLSSEIDVSPRTQPENKERAGRTATRATSSQNDRQWLEWWIIHSPYDESRQVVLLYRNRSGMWRQSRKAGAFSGKSHQIQSVSSRQTMRGGCAWTGGCEVKQGLAGQSSRSSVIQHGTQDDGDELIHVLQSMSRAVSRERERVRRVRNSDQVRCRAFRWCSRLRVDISQPQDLMLERCGPGYVSY